MTQLTTLQTGNFAEMAKMMGISEEGSSKSSSSKLPRLRIHRDAIMGTAEVNGKKVNVEVLPGGSYRLDIPDVGYYYASSVVIRPHLQRFMYKRYVQAKGNDKGYYVKSLMTDNAKMNVDLKDDRGGFNCGKQAGYIQDFNALSEAMKTAIREIKRVRVIFGEVDFIDPIDEDGNPVELETKPFIWEIDNKESFKELGTVFETFMKNQQLPVWHKVTCTAAERKIPTGAVYYVADTSLNLREPVEAGEEQEKLFADFASWVERYNDSIISKWSEVRQKEKDEMSEEDINIIENLVDVEVEEDIAL